MAEKILDLGLADRITDDETFLSEDLLILDNERRRERRRLLIEGLKEVKDPTVLRDIFAEAGLQATGILASRVVQISLTPAVMRIIERRLGIDDQDIEELEEE